MLSREERIRDAIMFNSGAEDREVTPNASLSDDLGMDSLDIAIFSMELEEEFEFEIPDEDIESFKTVQNIIDYIEGVENGWSK